MKSGLEYLGDLGIVRIFVADLSRKEKLQMAAALEDRAAMIRELAGEAETARAALTSDAATPPVPAGFFLINLAKWQQDRLRDLARECGYDLRGVVNRALTQARIRLEEQMEIARQTGLKPAQCSPFMSQFHEGNPDN